MKSQRLVIVTGCVVVVVYDLLAALAARSFGFSYGRAAIGSFLIYLIIGFFAAREARENRARVGAFSAAVAGFVDASIGWAISWSLGVGRVRSGSFSVGHWMITAMVVVIIAAVIGLVGGLLGARGRPGASLDS